MAFNYNKIFKYSKLILIFVIILHLIESDVKCSPLLNLGELTDGAGANIDIASVVGGKKKKSNKESDDDPLKQLGSALSATGGELTNISEDLAKSSNSTKKKSKPIRSKLVKLLQEKNYTENFNVNLGELKLNTGIPGAKLIDKQKDIKKSLSKTAEELDLLATDDQGKKNGTTESEEGNTNESVSTEVQSLGSTKKNDPFDENSNPAYLDNSSTIPHESNGSDRLIKGLKVLKSKKTEDIVIVIPEGVAAAPTLSHNKLEERPIKGLKGLKSKKKDENIENMPEGVAAAPENVNGEEPKESKDKLKSKKIKQVKKIEKIEKRSKKKFESND